jgi:hypothetical protein
MKRAHSTRILAAAAGVAFFAACHSESEPLGPQPGGGDEISAAEAAAINEVLIGFAFDGWDLGDFGSTSRAPGEGIALSSVPIAIDFAIDTSAPCPQGGTAAVSGSIEGSVDDQTFAGNLDLTVATTLTDCAATADGKGFTFNTSPSLVLDGSFAWDQTGLSDVAAFTYAGSVDWVTGDRSGTCAYDVQVSVSPSGATAANGTVCGISIND